MFFGLVFDLGLDGVVVDVGCVERFVRPIGIIRLPQRNIGEFFLVLFGFAIGSQFFFVLCSPLLVIPICNDVVNTVYEYFGPQLAFEMSVFESFVLLPANLLEKF